MARKKSTAKKLTPAVRYLRYELTNSGDANTETSHYIDLARDLSIVNRRLYRQGREYHVKKISVVSINTISGWTSYVAPQPDEQQNAGFISASVIPSSWVSHMAWKRGYNVWRKMYDRAARNISGDVEGTWSDFKVFIDNDMRSGTVLRPLDNGGNQYNLGEWDYSNYVSPDGTTSSDTMEVHMLGNHSGSAGAWNSISLIKSFGESRSTVHTGDPNVPADASTDPLINVFDSGTEIDEVVNIMEDFGDNPPYSVTNYPGDELNGPKPIVAQHTSIDNGRGTLSGFTALCGLLELEVKSPIASDVYSIVVELAPGKYRGLKAESI